MLKIAQTILILQRINQFILASKYVYERRLLQKTKRQFQTAFVNLL
jgi:hypothetical protein